ncbi:hypothetical protein OAK19_03295 [Aureispira]|nr:hypothetical protein [Aureispira sp.]
MKKPTQIDINLEQKNTKTKKARSKETSDNDTELSKKIIKDHKTAMNISIQKVKKNI